MRTLVIHPHDTSTHFLKPIYEDIPNKTVITGGLFIAEVEDLISMHDRVIMLGHGSPKGLFGINFNRTYVIDESIVPRLKYSENIFIWCHADQFVKQHGLKGLYSGMFVSETVEALMYKLKNDEKLITDSNNGFAFILGSVINKMPLNEAYNQVKKDYGFLAKSNEIANYNNERLNYIA